MKSRSKNYLAILLLFFTLFACEKTITTVPDKIVDQVPLATSDVSVREAKTWFEKEYLPSQKKSETTIAKTMIRNAFWEKAYMDKMSNGQDLLVVPIEHYESNRLPNADTYLWVFRDDAKNYSAKVIEYLTSLRDYEGEIDIANFSGAMTVRDWNGKLLNGFTFKKGKPVGLLVSVRGVETERVQEGKSGRFNGTICNTLKFTLSSCTSFAYKLCTNGNCTELRPNDTPTYCDLYEITVPQCYWVADFPNQTNPYASGIPSEIKARSVSELTMPGFSGPGINLAKFIKCFGTINANSKYKITFYVVEPKPGTGKIVNGFDVGHTFMSFEMNTNGVIVTQTVGFYPNTMAPDWVQSRVLDNGGLAYTVSSTHENIGADAFQHALAELEVIGNRMYHYSGYNCTTAAASVATAAGLTLPKNETYFPFGTGKGLSPGQLGYDLRANQSSGTLNTNGGTAPASKGACN